MIGTGLTIAGVAALVIAVIVIVDPLGDFETGLGDLRTFEYSPLVTTNLVKKLRTKRYVLVFGTSRVRLLSRRYLGEDTLNFHVLYGNPRAILELLKGLDAVQVNNIAKIYILLDLHTLGHDAYLHKVAYDSTLGRLAYRAERIETYLRAAVTKLWRNATGRYGYFVHPRGYTVPVQDRSNLCDVPFKGAKIREPGREELAALASIAAFAKYHGIRVIFFAAPVSRKFYSGIDKGVLAKWRRAVVSHISGYYDLLSLPQVVDDCALWADAIHLNGKGTILMLKALASKKYFLTAKHPGGVD